MLYPFFQGLIYVWKLESLQYVNTVNEIYKNISYSIYKLKLSKNNEIILPFRMLRETERIKGLGSGDTQFDKGAKQIIHDT